MKKMILLGLVALMIVGVTYVYAQGPRPNPEGKPFWGPLGPGKWSSLTPEQRTKFQELRQKFDEETAQLRGNILTKRLELRSLWTNPKADSKAIQDKEKELRELQSQMREKMVQYKLEARKLLTPEQLSQLGPGFGMGFGFGRGHRMGHGKGIGPRGGMGMCL